MRPEERRLLLASLAWGAVAVVALSLVLARSPFPPGGDPGHMLALSHALDGNGPEGPLAYAPAVPAVVAGLRALAGDDPLHVLLAIKVLGVLAFLAQPAGLAALAGALAGARAAAWAFAIGVTNPLAWYQVLWGGYPQFLAVGLGAAALGLLLRGLPAGTDRVAPLPVARLLAAGALLGGVVATHTYSSVFFGFAAAALLAQRATRGGAQPVANAAGVLAVPAMLVAAPAIPVYLHIAASLQGGAGGGGYAASLRDLGAGLRSHWQVALLCLLLLGLTWRAGTPGGAGRAGFDSGGRPVVAAAAIGVLALLAITPSFLLERLFDFAAAIAVVAAAVRFARHDGAGTARFAGRDAHRALALLLAGLLLFTWRDVSRDAPRFSALDADDAQAMTAGLPPGEGRVLVVSPWPNADGWWLEGLTGRPALIGDLLKWYALAPEAERAVAARTLGRATLTLDGGPVKLLDATSIGSPVAPEWWILGDASYHPLLFADPGGERAVVRVAEGDERTWWPALPDEVRAHPGPPAIRSTGASGILRLEREVRGTGEAGEIAWTVRATEGTVARAGVAFVVSDGVAARGVAREPDGVKLTTKLLFEGVERVVKLEVVAPRGWTHTFTPVGPRGTAVLAFEVEGDGTASLQFAVRLRVEGFRADAWTLLPSDDLLERWNVTAAYVRGEVDRERFEADPRFERHHAEGDVVVYRVRPRPPEAPA